MTSCFSLQTDRDSLTMKLTHQSSWSCIVCNEVLWLGIIEWILSDIIRDEKEDTWFKSCTNTSFCMKSLNDSLKITEIWFYFKTFWSVKIKFNTKRTHFLLLKLFLVHLKQFQLFKTESHGSSQLTVYWSCADNLEKRCR